VGVKPTANNKNKCSPEGVEQDKKVCITKSFEVELRRLLKEHRIVENDKFFT